jgi:hypothetical protein
MGISHITHHVHRMHAKFRWGARAIELIVDGLQECIEDGWIRGGCDGRRFGVTNQWGWWLSR